MLVREPGRAQVGSYCNADQDPQAYLHPDAYADADTDSDIDTDPDEYLDALAGTHRHTCRPHGHVYPGATDAHAGTADKHTRAYADTQANQKTDVQATAETHQETDAEATDKHPGATVRVER